MNPLYTKNYLRAFYTLLLISSLLPLNAQNYAFHSQSEVNAFSSTASTIDGNVIINGEDISNLAALSLIQHITGNLIIGDTLDSNNGNLILENLEGLNNLQTIGKDLRIIQNTTLNSLYGLQNLQTIGEDIILKNLPLLNSLSDLQLTTSNLNGDLYIQNTALNSLEGLHNFHVISGNFSLFDNQNLTQIDLTYLTHINGGMHLINNANLPNFTGLESFESLGTDLIIIINNGITSLDGLENLSIIDGDLAIVANGALSNLDGLSNVELVTDSLIVNYNSSLEVCCGIFPSLMNENTGLTIIEANSTNCNSPEEIIDYCSTIDTDEDGIADILDNCPWIANPNQVDADADGFGEICDCDDNEATVNADAEEIFNNDVDDDCDGEIDEGSPIVPDCSPFSATIISQTEVSCHGGNDGAIHLSFEGATMPVNCDWTQNLDDSQDIENLSAGHYDVVLTDANGCSTSLSTIISEPQAIAVEFTTMASNCDEINGQIDLSVTGGTAPYSYSWTQGMGNTEDLQNLPADTYQVTVMDTNDCQNIASTTVIEYDCPDFIYFQFTDLRAEIMPSQEVNVVFSTIGEEGNGAFFLEHSIDGLEFETIGNQLEGNGPNESENFYSFVHLTPKIGFNFYRIMYLNIDNTIYRSELIEVFNKRNGANIVFPNPSPDIINIQLSTNENIDIEVYIYNETGRIMLNEKFVEETDLVSLDIRHFVPGIYFMRVHSGKSQLLTEKIVKIN